MTDKGTYIVISTEPVLKVRWIGLNIEPNSLIIETTKGLKHKPMKNLLLLTLVAVSCNVQDPELQRLEQLETERKEQAVKDSIHFERVERLINAGMTYDEAEAKVKEIESN